MKTALLAFVLVLCSTASFGQTPEENAKELLKLSGTYEMAEQVMSQMIEGYKKASPDTPNEFWDQFKKEVSNANKLIDMVAPLYVKHYTNDELIQLIQFYKSPLGRAFVKKTTLVTQESYAIGEKWGTEIAAEIMKKLGERNKK